MSNQSTFSCAGRMQERAVSTSGTMANGWIDPAVTIASRCV
jgi:hypothetical protein